MTETNELIQILYNSELHTQCPQCEESFPLSTSVMFDGNVEFEN